MLYELSIATQYSFSRIHVSLMDLGSSGGIIKHAKNYFDIHYKLRTQWTSSTSQCDFCNVFMLLVISTTHISFFATIGIFALGDPMPPQRSWLHRSLV